MTQTTEYELYVKDRFFTDYLQDEMNVNEYVENQLKDDEVLKLANEYTQNHFATKLLTKEFYKSVITAYEKSSLRTKDQPFDISLKQSLKAELQLRNAMPFIFDPNNERYSLDREENHDDK